MSTVHTFNEEKEKALTRLLATPLLVTFMTMIPLGLCDDFMVGDQALSQEAKGGGIYLVNIQATFNLSSKWVGYYGDLLTDGNITTGWLQISNISVSDESVTEFDLEMNCREFSGYLLISNESKIPEIDELEPGDLADFDALVGDGPDSASNTFRVNTTFAIADEVIPNVPTMYTNVNNQSQGVDFRQGYLTDGDAMVFIAIIDQDTVGFDGEPHDFQFMLPRAFSDYYLFALFNCKRCGDGICDEDENCSNCPDDCGECKPGKPQKPKKPGRSAHYIFPPTGAQLPPSCTDSVNISIDLEKNTVYVKQPIRGAVNLYYEGCRDRTSLLVVELDGGGGAVKHRTNLSAPFTRLELPFEFLSDEPGKHQIKASLTNIEGVDGEISVVVELLVVPHEEATPIQQRAIEPLKEKRELPFDLLLLVFLLIALALVILLILSVIRRRNSKQNEKRWSVMGWLTKLKRIMLNT